MDEVIKTRMIPEPYFNEEILHVGDRVHAKLLLSITYDKDGYETGRTYDIDHDAEIRYVTEKEIELQFCFCVITVKVDEVQSGIWEIEKL